MKKWKKNAVAVAVLLFVCAGIYVNWLSSGDNQPVLLTSTLDEEKLLGGDTLVLATDPVQVVSGDVDQTVSMEEYFAAVRLSRQESRDTAVSLLQEAMAYDDGEDSAASKELQEIVDMALREAQIESLIIAKGFTDCVAYMNEEGISVAVSAPEGGLQAEDVALITDVVMSQSDYTFADITVIGVN